MQQANRIRTAGNRDHKFHAGQLMQAQKTGYDKV
jgi:hypothetical protein